MRRGIALILAAAVLGSSCGSPATGDVTVSATDFKFAPNTLRWKVGEELRITLANDGEKDHEWVVGRDVMSMPGMAETFGSQFFEGVDVRFEQDGQAVDPMMVWMTGMGPNERAVNLPAGVRPTTMIFTVPNKPGEWQMACFADNGTHYEDGMRGKVTVVP